MYAGKVCAFHLTQVRGSSIGGCLGLVHDGIGGPHSDNSSVFIFHDTWRVCAQLGIEKKEIKKRSLPSVRRAA